MSETAATRVDVHIAEVSGSQLVIGDHNTVQTAKGTKVTVLQVGERPAPHLRKMPLTHRPPLRVDMFGRDSELAVAASASSEAPVQVYGPDGIGKTILLKRLAQRPGLRDGVIFESARRRTLDEILSLLYSACWECEVPFIPVPAEVGSFLTDREAFVVLDDCALDREDLEVLLDTAPRCAFVIGSEERTLWGQGSATRLPGLDPKAALQLLDHELGAAGAADRQAAETLVQRVGGHPQRIIEAAAFISAHAISIRELLDGSADLASRLASQPLAEGERRIIALLGLLDGAALGTAHISAVTGLPDANEQLVGLERKGWVKSASPSYRLLRRPREQDMERARGELTPALVAHLTHFADEAAAPSSVADEEEAIEATLALAAQAGRWSDVLALARATETKLAPSGAWSSWRRVLLHGLRAARALKDEDAESHMLHQLGSLALCLGAREEAASQLAQALNLRERLGDHAGARLTRHNLNQLEGGPPSGGNGKQPSDPGWPRRPMTLGILATVVAVLIAVGAVLALRSGGSHPVSSVGTVSHTSGSTATAVKPPAPPPQQPPALQLAQPTNGATYVQDSVVDASYACTPARGTQLLSCDGTVPNRQPIDTAVGTHHFELTAKESDGKTATLQVVYTVIRDTTPPVIAISVPANGATYMLTAASPTLVRFRCTDPGGSGVASCVGSLANGSPLNLLPSAAKPTTRRVIVKRAFVVNATDRAGNKSSKTVEYLLEWLPSQTTSTPPTSPSPPPTSPTTPTIP